VPRPSTDRILDIVEVVLWLGLLAFGSVVALEVLRQDAGRSRRSPPPEAVAPAGLVEAEDMAVWASSRKFTFWLQPTSDFLDGRWSKDGHMFAYGTQQGDWIDLELPAVEPDAYRLEAFFTRSADYGILAVFLNGTRVGGEIDLWSGYGVVPTEALDLGVVQLAGRGDVLRFQVVGHNPKAAPPYFQFGIDGVRLTRQEAATPQ
jgi:hypothetical protein